MDPLTSMALATALVLGAPTQARQSLNSTITRRTETSYVINPPVQISEDSLKYNAPVFAELLSYKRFADGWDGAGSLAPSLSDIDSAIAFVEMASYFLEPPGAMLSPEGHVGLYWNTPMTYIDINFEGDGTISVYARDRSATPHNESFFEGLDPTDKNSLMPILNLMKPMKLAA